MNVRTHAAAPLPADTERIARFAAWLEGVPDDDTDLDAVLLCHRVRRDGRIGIVELFDAE